MLKKPAILYDTTLCVGCRGCQVACKQWNGLPGEVTPWFQGGSYTNPAGVSADTWLLLQMHEEKIVQDKLVWTFTQHRCHHCIEPVCMENCPAEPKAISRNGQGIVLINPKLCIGCGTCQETCPFEVPYVSEKYEVARKCTMCIDRQKKGDIPACAKTCPTGATLFGEREELIREGRRRVMKFRDGHLYGEREGGGSAVLYVLPHGTAFAGLPEEPEPQSDRRPALPSRTHLLARMGGTASVVLGAFALGLAKLGERKEKIRQSKKEA